ASRGSAASAAEPFGFDAPRPAPASAVPANASPPSIAPADEPASVTLPSDEKPSLWPWLLLAAMIGAAAAFLLWRRHSREAFADGPSDDYAEPEPAAMPQAALRRAPEPAPVSRAAPPAAPAPAAPAGIV